MGHETGLMACDYFLNIIDGKPIKKDTLTIGHHYLRLTRDFTSIQNTSGYQTLKSRGFELVKNDSLRSQIIALYEYDYQSLRKIEEEYHEMQFQENYFHEINDMIAPHFVYDSLGSIVELEKPISMTNEEKKRFKSYLWKIRLNRNFVLRYYNGVNVRIKKLQSNIEKELD